MNSAESLEYIRDKAPDYIFSSWPKLINNDVLAAPRYFVIGTHPTELPRNRGRHPLHWIIDLGIMKTSLSFFMMDQGIDTINLRKGKISIRKSVRKSGMSKDAIRDGLMTFFGGDETKVEGALNAIKDGLKTKESTSLSLTGIKDKPEKEDK